MKGDLTLFNWGDGSGGLWAPIICELGICAGLLII